MAKIKPISLIFKGPRIVWHLLFWMVFISFFALVYGSFEENYGQQYLIQLSDAVVQIPAVYLTLYFLMPRYLFKERYMEFFSFIIIVILLFSAFSWWNYTFFQHPTFWPESTYEPYMLNYGKILKSTLEIYPVLFLSIGIKWFKYWYAEQKSNRLLIEEKLKAELNFLKAQVHPHFLFNTLNNLYALTLKKSKDAPEVVLKLSDLLNYMLYECAADEVLIEKEIKLVKDYIDLEKIRYGKRLNIAFNIRGNSAGKSMAPLMILPFVENSFKHGVSDEIDDSWVSIDLELEEQNLTLKVENSKSKEEHQDDQFNYKQGIGLKNVKRRLELIYPERHKLEMHDSDDAFLIILQLDLNQDAH